MHTLTLLINTTKYDEQVISKRFNIYARLHNIAIKHVKKLITRLERNNDYKTYLTEYKQLLQRSKLNQLEKQRKAELNKLLNNIRSDIGLTKANLYVYMKVVGKKYKANLSSQQVQSIANRVFISVEKYLFGNGKHIHYKKFYDISTIGGTSNINGVKFNKEALTADWLGLTLKVKLPKDVTYIKESLNSKISYCEVKRMMFNNGYHYYLIIYLDGIAPKKLANLNNNSTMGIDPGVSTIAAVSDKQLVILLESKKSRYFSDERMSK